MGIFQPAIGSKGQGQSAGKIDMQSGQFIIGSLLTAQRDLAGELAGGEPATLTVGNQLAGFKLDFVGNA